MKRILIMAVLLTGCASPTDPAPRVEPMGLHEWQADADADAHDRDTFQDTLQRSGPKDDSLNGWPLLMKGAIDRPARLSISWLPHLPGLTTLRI